MKSGLKLSIFVIVAIFCSSPTFGGVNDLFFDAVEVNDGRIPLSDRTIKESAEDEIQAAVESLYNASLNEIQEKANGIMECDSNRSCTASAWGNTASSPSYYLGHIIYSYEAFEEMNYQDQQAFLDLTKRLHFQSLAVCHMNKYPQGRECRLSGSRAASQLNSTPLVCHQSSCKVEEQSVISVSEYDKDSHELCKTYSGTLANGQICVVTGYSNPNQ